MGDLVLAKQQYKNKFSSKFDTVPYTVIQRKGTMITAENKKRRITRNVSHFKKFKAWVDSQNDNDCDAEQDMTREEFRPEQEHAHESNVRHQTARNRNQPVRYGDLIPSRLIP